MKRGEVWLLNLDPTIGDEIRKTRPVVIVSDDEVGRLDLKVVVPVTHWREEFDTVSWMVRIERTSQNGLSNRSGADAFQVRSVSTLRFVRRLGVLSDGLMSEIEDALAVVLKIS